MTEPADTIDPLDFLRHHDQPIDWPHHDRGAARARLAPTRDAADARRLERGALRFCPDAGLVNAINAAIASRSPLLLTGEPGTGKTQTAYYLAEYFGLPEPFHFQVRSDSSAESLRWDYDAVAYLHDAYLAGSDPKIAKRLLDLRKRWGDPRAAPRYLTPGKLWQAYEHDGECVLLIDEIDKAPRDFPNDLLLELSEHRFDHPFLPRRVERAAHLPPPLLVITSNGERRLPDPFLRRCIVHRITLTDDLLERILAAWRSSFLERLSPTEQARWTAPDGTEAAALERFQQFREQLGERGRAPGAAELLVWLGILATAGIGADDLRAQPLTQTTGIGCLLKEWDDLALLDPGRA
jgi:MoxR-like ATPase